MTLDDRIFHPTTPRAIDPARLTIVTDAAAEPWTVSDAEVGYHLRRDSSDDDAYVTHLIKAARRQFERMTGLALVNQTLKATWDRLPSRNGATLTEVDLPRAPLSSISSVKYLDSTGAEQTFSASAYSAKDVACVGAFGRLALKPDYDWPELGDYKGAFYVTFVSGFGASAASIPEDIRLAILWMVAWWYEERLPVNVGNIVNPLPAHLTDMIEGHRVAFIA